MRLHKFIVELNIERFSDYKLSMLEFIFIDSFQETIVKQN